MPCFGVVLRQGGLVQRPHLHVRQHVDESEVPEPRESLPPHLELHRLHGGRAQDAPVALLYFSFRFSCRAMTPCNGDAPGRSQKRDVAKDAGEVCGGSLFTFGSRAYRKSPPGLS